MRSEFSRPAQASYDAQLAPRSEQERPVSEIVADLWENTEKLVRQEMQLGMAELDERVAQVKRDLVLKAAGGALLWTGFLAVISALIMLLGKAIDPWLSALVVGVVLLGTGYLFEQRHKPSTRNLLTHDDRKHGHALKEAMK
jgi:hypothetical protein